MINFNSRLFFNRSKKATFAVKAVKQQQGDFKKQNTHYNIYIDRFIIRITNNFVFFGTKTKDSSETRTAQQLQGLQSAYKRQRSH